MSKQEGPGRPPVRNANSMLSVRCSKELRQTIKEQAAKRGISQGELIELAVMRLA